MTTRLLTVALCLLLGSVVLARYSRSEPVPIRQPLETVPWNIGEWNGRQAAPLTDEVLSVLGVDEYLNRAYLGPRGWAGLYVGYYGSQRQGDTMHSPLNCLPGAGWVPVAQKRSRLTVADGGVMREIEVNNFVIEKGLDRQVVVYWYQSHGRVVASEYWGKIYTVIDAIRFNQSDGALVRVIVPVRAASDVAREEAEQIALSFVREVFPVLSPHLPSWPGGREG